ncbi:hypothetical protein [Nocardia camponoti]|uniref:Uncharacterized protein n=1 Tax=Nocardia camponoti TaxID=1616106 RepID=A0A917QPP5_9NOCA|nr:hypothetical protein [Nocardia camponoti]GGK62162.1 hypothetical protein GCM10011591_38030 [Nocardia camponoti]
MRFVFGERKIVAVRYTNAECVNFRDYPFDPPSGPACQWIDIKHFSIGNVCLSDQELLAELISQPEYHDGYIGAGVVPSDPRHGPYWISAISPGEFIKVTAAEATAETHKWTANCGTLRPELTARIEATVLTRFAEGNAIFVLPKLPDSAHHDYGWIHTEFHEFAVVSADRTRLSLMVLADD